MTPIRISFRLFRAASLIAALLALPAMAQAIPIEIEGVLSLNNLGSFTGTFDYNASTETVVVTLTNTSSSGYITAFAFNIPEGQTVNGALPLASTSPTFMGFLGPGTSFSNGVNANPFGNFDIGATTDATVNDGSSWQGSGDPARGIGVGGTVTFTFDLDLSGPLLDAGAFLSALSENGGQDEYPFAVRFRGFTEGGSDKVVGGAAGGVIPEPGTLLLLGGGLTALAMRRRRPRG